MNRLVRPSRTHHGSPETRRLFPLGLLLSLWAVFAVLPAAAGTVDFSVGCYATGEQVRTALRKLDSAPDAFGAGDELFRARSRDAGTAGSDAAAEHGAGSKETQDLLSSMFPDLPGFDTSGDSGSMGGAKGEPGTPASPIILAPKAPEPHVRWKPLLLQSLNFLLVEHTFRYLQQSDLRYQTWHKPFWEDYFISLRHTDLSHWGDGDNFLTNYVGHPLEGAVSGDIWIQNDPQAANAQFGSGAYWRSRLKAMGWAALYSLQFEEGPILSETALGNQGGYYFVPGCGPSPCSKPGKTLKPPTLGTGWVDLVITPTVGLAWILMEDTITAKLMPRLAGENPSLAWRIVGAALTPSRSMASFMAGHLPWVRHSEDTEIVRERTAVALSKRSEGDGFRFEAGIHYVTLNLPMDWAGCTACHVVNSGVGGVFAYRLSRSFWFDAETNYFPGDGGTDKGSTMEGLYGIRYGITHSRWAAYAKLRPGFIYYDQASSYPHAGELRELTRFAFDAGGIVEYHASRQGTLRLDVGATFVRYLQGVDPLQPQVGWISPDYYATQGNFQLAFGYARRF